MTLAVANRPPRSLADEPIGSLNREALAKLLDALRQVNQALVVAIIIVTHDQQIVQSVRRVVPIRDGKTISEFFRRDWKGVVAGALSPSARARCLEETGTQEKFAVLDWVGRV